MSRHKKPAVAQWAGGEAIMEYPENLRYRLTLAHGKAPSVTMAFLRGSEEVLNRIQATSPQQQATLKQAAELAIAAEAVIITASKTQGGWELGLRSYGGTGRTPAYITEDGDLRGMKDALVDMGHKVKHLTFPTGPSNNGSRKTTDANVGRRYAAAYGR